MGPTLGNSAIAPYIKLAAIVILVVTYLAALGYALYALIRNNGTALPSSVTLIIGTGLSFALQVLSAHQTVSLTENKNGAHDASPPTP